MGSWDDGSAGYSQDDEYAAPGGDGGYLPDDSYAGYEDYGQGGHAAPGRHSSAGGIGATNGYGATGGYGEDRFADPGGYSQRGAHAYPDANGYADSGTYDSGTYADSGGYADSGTYADSGGYADDGRYGSQYGQPSGYGQPSDYGQQGGHGGYPASGYGHSGGYPAIGAGSGDQEADGYTGAGNDWYNAQPGAASGSGFADTGTFNARAVGSYGTGPRPAARDLSGYDEPGYDGYQDDTSSQLTTHDPVRGFPPSRTGPRPQLNAAPQDLVHTGQQERYDDAEYESYAGYDGQGDYDQAQGYGPAGGYQTTRGYDQYDEPEAFGTRAYDVDPDYEAGPSLDLVPGYDDEDPYQERYGDGDTGPRPRGGRKQKKPGRGRVRLLLLSAAAVVVVGVAGAAVYTFVLKHKPSSSNSSLSTGPLPSAGSTSAATAACVKQLGSYCHIELRADDPAPLTLDELYPPAFMNETDHTSFTRLATKLDKTCSNAVIGQDLISALQSGKCTQVLRASYASADNTILGTIGVVNLETTNEAHHAGKLVGQNDFVDPLSTSKGVGSKLGSGTGVVEAEYKGHYLLLIWAEFSTGKAPKTAAQDRELYQFEADLVAGTANPALSERMVNGSPSIAAS